MCLDLLAFTPLGRRGHPSLVGNISKQILPGEEPGEFILRSVLKCKSTDDVVDQMIRRNIGGFVKDEQEKVRKRVAKAAST